jgi:hypothetical protein
LGSVTTSAIDARERSPDSQRSSVEVDVRPLEGECLAAAQSGVDKELEQGRVTASRSRAEQIGDLGW